MTSYFVISSYVHYRLLISFDEQMRLTYSITDIITACMELGQVTITLITLGYLRINDVQTRLPTIIPLEQQYPLFPVHLSINTSHSNQIKQNENFYIWKWKWPSQHGQDPSVKYQHQQFSPEKLYNLTMLPTSFQIHIQNQPVMIKNIKSTTLINKRKRKMRRLCIPKK